MLKLGDDLRTEVEKQWMEFEAFLSKNKERFTEIIEGGKEQFLKTYAWVCTRCFGYQLSFTFMAPFADCLNHNHNSDTTFYMVNKDLHLRPMTHKSYFKSEKYLNNMALIY